MFPSGYFLAVTTVDLKARNPNIYCYILDFIQRKSGKGTVRIYDRKFHLERYLCVKKRRLYI